MLREYSLEYLIEDVAMPVVANAGEAKSFLMEALDRARKGNFEDANLLVQDAEISLEKAHKAHHEIVRQSSIDPESIQTPFMLIHAEDHLMSAMSKKNLVVELINVYKEIWEIRNFLKIDKDDIESKLGGLIW